eukprot:14963706-Ditylum_brightwellii.AAC.1
MGKLPLNANSCNSPGCKDRDAAICEHKSRRQSGCLDGKLFSPTLKNNRETKDENGGTSTGEEKSSIVDKRSDKSVKELLIVGSGPHALTLLLRLLEPYPDFLSEKKRHLLAESTARMRPLREVHRHESEISPPLSLKTVIESVQVVDAGGDWLASWKKNFNGIGITQLRSLMNAHSDPYDHRSLEYFAELRGRGDELVTLKDLTQRDNMFRGPYQ